MQPEIRTTPLALTLHGRSLRHDHARRYGEEILLLLNQVWPLLKSNNVPNDGINRVLYEAGHIVFAGVVLAPGAETIPGVGELERKQVHLTRYAYWKHVGPYSGIPTTSSTMIKSLEAQGMRHTMPMLEVYGHWTSDESKLETETFVAIA